jgi:hypothetical protein
MLTSGCGSDSYSDPDPTGYLIKIFDFFSGPGPYPPLIGLRQHRGKICGGRAMNAQITFIYQTFGKITK